MKCGDDGIAALAAGGDRLGPHLIAELDDRDEAVAARAVHLLRAWIGARAERRQRAPARRGEADRNARRRVVEWLHDVAGEALKAIDVAPRRLPRAEVGRQLVGRRGQRLQQLLRPSPWSPRTRRSDTPALRASSATRRPISSPQYTASDVGTDVSDQR